MRKAIPLLVFALFLAACTQNPSQDSAKVTINDVVIAVEIADSPSEIAKGLMFRESLRENEGMLFVFDDENYRSFWMKNTLIPLDMLFISGNGTIVDMKEQFEPCRTEFCESYRSKGKMKYVLEVNGGFAERNNVRAGDHVYMHINTISE